MHLQSEVSDVAYSLQPESTSDSVSPTNYTLSEKIAKALQERRTWEVPHSSYDTDLNIIFACASVLSQSSFSVGAFQYLLPGDPRSYYDSLDISAVDSSMQFHLAFTRPQNASDRSVWANKIATISYVLNDRSSLYAFADNSDNLQSRYLGPFYSSFKPYLSETLNFPTIPKITKDADLKLNATSKYHYPDNLATNGQTCKHLVSNAESYECDNKGVLKVECVYLLQACT